MRRIIVLCVMLGIVLSAGVAQAGFGIKKLKVDKKALAGGAQDKMVQDLLKSVNGSMGEIGALKDGVTLDKGLFDVSTLVGAADAQLKFLSEQTAKIDAVVAKLKKKKSDITKAVDQVRKEAEKAKDDAKASAEKTLGDLEGALARITAVETYTATLGEQLKAWEGELGELKALGAKMSKQATTYTGRLQESAAAAGISAK